MRIGPEPTTDSFIAVMQGDVEGIVPGNALVVDPKKPFRKLNAFGNAFLNRSVIKNLLWSIWLKLNEQHSQQFKRVRHYTLLLPLLFAHPRGNYKAIPVLPGMHQSLTEGQIKKVGQNFILAEQTKQRIKPSLSRSCCRSLEVNTLPYISLSLVLIFLAASVLQSVQFLAAKQSSQTQPVKSVEWNWYNTHIFAFLHFFHNYLNLSAF